MQIEKTARTEKGAITGREPYTSTSLPVMGPKKKRQNTWRVGIQAKDEVLDVGRRTVS